MSKARSLRGSPDTLQACRAPLTVTGALRPAPPPVGLAADVEVAPLSVALPALQPQPGPVGQAVALAPGPQDPQTRAQDWWVTPDPVAGRGRARPGTVRLADQLLGPKEAMSLLAGKAHDVAKLPGHPHHEAVCGGVQQRAPHSWGQDSVRLGLGWPHSGTAGSPGSRCRSPGSTVPPGPPAAGPPGS